MHLGVSINLKLLSPKVSLTSHSENVQLYRVCMCDHFQSPSRCSFSEKSKQPKAKVLDFLDLGQESIGSFSEKFNLGIGIASGGNLGWLGNSIKPFFVSE